MDIIAYSRDFNIQDPIAIMSMYLIMLLVS